MAYKLARYELTVWLLSPRAAAISLTGLAATIIWSTSCSRGDRRGGITLTGGWGLSIRAVPRDLKSSEFTGILLSILSVTPDITYFVGLNLLVPLLIGELSKRHACLKISAVSEATNKAARQAAIDRFGEADRQFKLWTPPVNPHAAEKAAALAALEEMYAEFPAERGDVADSPKYQVTVSARQNHRELTPEATSKAFYKIRLLKSIVDGKIVRFDPFTVFTVTLDAIKKHLGQAYLDEIAPEERTGRRTYTAVAKAEAVKAA